MLILNDALNYSTFIVFVNNYNNNEKNKNYFHGKLL